MELVNSRFGWRIGVRVELAQRQSADYVVSLVINDNPRALEILLRQNKQPGCRLARTRLADNGGSILAPRQPPSPPIEEEVHLAIPPTVDISPRNNSSGDKIRGFDKIGGLGGGIIVMLRSDRQSL